MSWTDHFERPRACRWVPDGFRLLAIGLGGAHTWAAVKSQSMNADGISYLDIGDAYMRGDWATALNPVWSPMYSWILGPIMHLVQPSMQWEFPLVQLTNFVIYLLALTCFSFFWGELRRDHVGRRNRWSERSTTLPGWAWGSLGYLLFIFCSLHLIEIWAATPDMLMSAFLYLAAGVLVRIRRSGPTLARYGGLGALLGLCYLAKAVMFPVALVILAVGVFVTADPRRGWPYAGAALVVFLLLSVPFIALVSFSKGELKFGDAGKLTHLRYVGGLPYPHWQGEPDGSGIPQHPTRKIFSEPPVYEFDGPISGTYPVSLDPSYWYAGARFQADIVKQLNFMLFSLRYYLDLFFWQLAGVSFGLMLLYLRGRRRKLTLPALFARWSLLIPAIAALALYGAILVSGRYIGMFVVLLFGELLTNVCLSASRHHRQLIRYTSLVMIVFMLVSIGIYNLDGLRDLTGQGNPYQRTVNTGPGPASQLSVAEALQRIGLQADDPVGVIGYGFTAFWARLAKVKIVAELLDSDAQPFWSGDQALRSRVLSAFAAAGSKAVIAEWVPAYASLSGWQQVGKSNYYIYLIEQDGFAP